MYKEKIFAIPELIGISEKNVHEHIKLYQGYVKNTNMILDTLAGSDGSDYERAELQRRLSFEFNGMKNHEYYFASLEGGSASLTTGGPLAKKIDEDFGSFDDWMNRIKAIAKTRGIGWAVLGYDAEHDMLVNYWVEEQHWGHLNSVQYIIGIDMWEHAFVADYQPSGKGDYINDYFKNVNWKIVEKNFTA